MQELTIKASNLKSPCCKNGLMKGKDKVNGKFTRKICSICKKSYNVDYGDSFSELAISRELTQPAGEDIESIDLSKGTMGQNRGGLMASIPEEAEMGLDEEDFVGDLVNATILARPRRNPKSNQLFIVIDVKAKVNKDEIQSRVAIIGESVYKKLLKTQCGKIKTKDGVVKFIRVPTAHLLDNKGTGKIKDWITDEY